jgi:hypothetical protein
MSRTGQKKQSRQGLTLEERIHHILGQAIEHGYQDGRAGKHAPDTDCQAFAVALTNELLQSFIEWANHNAVSTVKMRKVD